MLAQSLLMSPATPIVDENSGLPYPVIQQGAGLGNINDAMNADSYIMVDGQPDGKVKVELGTTPTAPASTPLITPLYNMEDEARQYTLDTNVFTQASGQFYLEEYGEEDWYTDYTLTKLAAVTTYSVGGREILPEAGQLTGLDCSGDGKINAADGQALLDYAVGKLNSLTNQDKADLNGDGKITAYDAELFLSRLGKCVVEAARQRRGQGDCHHHPARHREGRAGQGLHQRRLHPGLQLRHPLRHGRGRSGRHPLHPRAGLLRRLGRAEYV